MNKATIAVIVIAVIGLSLAGQVYAKTIYVPSECKSYVEQAVQDATATTVTTTITVIQASSTENIGGLPAEVTYSAIAVAVIAIIAAALLAARHRTN